MASVDRNKINSIAATTTLLVAPSGEDLFAGEIAFVSDAIPDLAFQFPVGNQHLDAAYGRAQKSGRGVVGEGGDSGPGVVGIAGGVIANPGHPFPRPLHKGPHLGRGFHAGVVGFGADPRGDDERGSGDAVGVLGHAQKSLGVWGRSTGNAGVYGQSRTTGVIGDGTAGQTGVEGFGSMYGVYGHVNFGDPNPDGIGVFGAAAIDLDNLDNYTGRAGVFVGPVDVVGNLTVTGNSVVWGTKSAAATHDDGTHRLLYCIESPDCQIEDFGEASLAKGAAKVKLDRDFAAVADTTSYHVFLTSYGDSNGLYVSARNRNGFEVREQGAGKSSLKFSYRVVALRKNVKTKRFQKVARPKKPKSPTPLAPPDFDREQKKPATRRRAKTKRAKR